MMSIYSITAINKSRYTYFKIMLSLLPLPLLLLPLLLWPSYICQVRPRTVFFLFELCCHACPCAVPNHPWLCPTSVGVLRQSWPRQGRKPPTAGRKTTANGWRFSSLAWSALAENPHTC